MVTWPAKVKQRASKWTHRGAMHSGHPVSWHLPRPGSPAWTLTFTHTETRNAWAWLNGIALHGIPISQIYSITCHMGSHGVTCHPIQMNVSCLNPSQTDRYSIYLPQRDGRLSWPWCWLYCKTVYLVVDVVSPLGTAFMGGGAYAPKGWDGLPVCRQSPIQVVTTW